ncbi:hypothetical protein YPPY103_0188, partial [Yersinia pestis PY-103]
MLLTRLIYFSLSIK